MEQITFRWKRPEYLKSTGNCFGNLYCEYSAVVRGSALRVLPVLPSILGFDTAGTVCTRGSVLLILPVLEVLGPSLLLKLPVLAEYVGRQHSNTLQYPSTKCTRYSRVYPGV